MAVVTHVAMIERAEQAALVADPVATTIALQAIRIVAVVAVADLAEEEAEIAETTIDAVEGI